jgi:hypothetical protein
MSALETLGQLQPGDAIQLPDVSHLAAFEDMVALTTLPAISESIRHPFSTEMGQ